MSAAVNLYWLPLGAGGHSVRYNGRVYEWLVSRLEDRRACDLYHAALEVQSEHTRYVVEMAPVARGDPTARGCVAEGPVGTRAAGRLRLFRYEIRCWRDGVIPDIEEAACRQRLHLDGQLADRLLECVSDVPMLTWGRDELGVGDMWNSNSLISWILTASGIGTEWVRFPRGGRAPGWQAGLASAPHPLVSGIGSAEG